VVNGWCRRWAKLNYIFYCAISRWWLFAGTGLLTTGIAFITVGFQAIKSARANAVNSIRAE